MKRSIKKATPKRRGRPATGKAPTRTLRLTDEFLDKIDHWATQQEDQPSRSEAIRRLVERGLTINPRAKQPSPAHAARAKELARTAIDKMSDATAPLEEREQRRRRLTKGPLEFREARMDQPKSKGK
jgi:Arc/MetJ-type ribon-helix-helix transcriptional regulator